MEDVEYWLQVSRMEKVFVSMRTCVPSPMIKSSDESGVSHLLENYFLPGLGFGTISLSVGFLE